MPVVSQAQNRFMQGCKHNPEHMKGKCPPPSVVAEFTPAGMSVKGLPERKDRPHASPPTTDAEAARGYRSLGRGL